MRGARSSHRSASCASSVLVSQEDRLPCPGSSMLLLGSLHSCFFSSHSVPCHLCGHTKPLRCPGARRSRGAMPGGFAVACGAGAVPTVREGSAGTGCAAIPVCVLCCSVLAAALGSVGLLPFPVQSRGGPGDSGGARGVTSPAPRRGHCRGSPPHLPVTPAIYSSR